MKRLPIGIQDFRELREGNRLYVDKTKYLYELTAGKYYFLSRPRRFGKSLLVSTLKELFSGSCELFEGLWIEPHWNWEEKNPVIQIGFSSLGYRDMDLREAIQKRLYEVARTYDIQLDQTTNHALQFRELIQKLFQRFGKVVILIDEYDKPIIDYLDELPKAKENREILKSFYAVLKDADAHLRMVFITGVSKFSKTSIFSDLNHLEDLFIHPRYNTMLGYTQEELEYYFSEYIEKLTEQYGGKTSFLAMVKDWYNGYSWDGTSRVYNPFSILNFFSKGIFLNHWFGTGTPTFLIKLLRKHEVYQISDTIVDLSSFDSYDIEDISPLTLLFQTGYLTIQEALPMQLYRLSYPNREVKDAMLRYLLMNYTGRKQGEVAPATLMAKAILEHNLEELRKQMNVLLAKIPYDLHQNTESYYHTIMYLAFSLVGVHIHCEVHHAQGRLDAVVETSEKIYIFEFKVNRSAKEALEQIKAKAYAAPYLGKRPVLAVGVNFSTEEKTINDWAVEHY